MGEINKIIDDFFEAAAKSIMRNIADVLLENPRKNKGLKQNILDVIVAKGYSTIEVQEKYLELLDEIDRMVYGEIDKKNSYVNYYKGNELFQTDVNISDIIEKVKQSSNSGDMAESLKEEVRKKLLEKNGYRRIAQLYYYKKNHKWYEEEVEEAYREVIVEIIGDGKEKCFTEMFAQKIENRTQEIVGSAINSVYRNIYINSLSDEYQPSIDDYICDIDSNTMIYAVSTNNSPIQNNKYYKEIIKVVDATQRISIEKSFDDFCQIVGDLKKKMEVVKLHKNSDENVSERTYREFLKRTFFNIGGFDYYDINLKCDNKFTDKFIPKVLSNDLNYILLILLTMNKKSKNKYKTISDSRFVLINDFIDFGIVREAILIHKSIVESVIRQFELQEKVIEEDYCEEAEFFINSQLEKERREIIDMWLKKDA